MFLSEQPEDEKVYVDSCGFGRLYDNESQAKVKAEADAIRKTIEHCRLGEFSIIGSAVVVSEIRAIEDDDEKRDALEKIYNEVAVNAPLTAQCLARAHQLHLAGLGVMDSRHLAVAEAEGAGFLLTTDMDFIKKCARPNFTKVKVINPLDFERRLL